MIFVILARIFVIFMIWSRFCDWHDFGQDFNDLKDFAGFGQDLCDFGDCWDFEGFEWF